MITIITDKREISALQTRLEKQIGKYATENISCFVGYPSGRFQDIVKYSHQLNIWFSNRDFGNHYYNGFGIGKPQEGKGVSLIGEINIPYSGIKRTSAGAFAKDENGNILLLHRGKIGGGKKGVGKKLFFEKFRGDFVTAVDGDRETEFCLVGELGTPLFPYQVANFIKEIDRVKHLDASAESSVTDIVENYDFSEEHHGRSKVKRSGVGTIERTHGLVVNALAAQLQRHNVEVGNNRNIDLFIHKNGKIKTLFEVKTNCNTQSLATAIGQLIMYSIPLKDEVKKIIVIPQRLNKAVSKEFREFGIIVLYYEWQDNIPSFTNLMDIFRK